MLKKLQVMQCVGIAESNWFMMSGDVRDLQNESGVVLLLPILQVFEIIDKGWLVQDALLRQRMKIERIC
jgi:hypothetical protein